MARKSSPIRVAKAAIVPMPRRAFRTRRNAGPIGRMCVTLSVFALAAACVAAPDVGGAGASGSAARAAPAISPSAAVQPSGSPVSSRAPVVAVALSISAATPTSIAGKPWAASSASGAVYAGARLDQSARLAEGGERVMTLLDDAVLTQDAHDGSLHLRPLGGTSDKAMAATVPGKTSNATRWVSAEPSGASIFLSGSTWNSGSRDTGIVALDVATGTTRQVTLPSVLSGADINHDVFRVTTLDPSGTHGATALCDADTCELSAFDPSTGTTTALTSIPEGLVAAGDGSAIVMSQTSLRAIDLSSGRTVWQFGGAEFQEGFRLDGDRWVQSSIDRANGWAYTVAVIDLSTGKRKVIWTAPVDENRVLYRELSTADAVTFGSEALSLELDSPAVTASVLDLSSGRVLKDVVRLAIAR
jgi:hypothetical protein